MARAFEVELARFERWIAGCEGFSVLYVDYRDALDDARRQAERIDRFLGGGLDTVSMAAAIDPSLYRNRL